MLEVVWEINLVLHIHLRRRLLPSKLLGLLLLQLLLLTELLLGKTLVLLRLSLLDHLLLARHCLLLLSSNKLLLSKLGLPLVLLVHKLVGKGAWLGLPNACLVHHPVLGSLSTLGKQLTACRKTSLAFWVLKRL